MKSFATRGHEPLRTDVATSCMGVDVPASPVLTEGRLARIAAGRYRQQKIVGALRVARAGDTILEIGVGLGIVGAVIMRNMRPDRIVSFEVNPALIRYARSLHAMNGIEERISIHNAAVMAGPGIPPEVTLHLRSGGNGEVGHLRPVRVPVADFSEVVGVVRPDILVLDVREHEIEILRHADLSDLRGLVIDFRRDAFSPETLRELRRRLRGAGFDRIANCSNRTLWTFEKRRTA